MRKVSLCACVIALCFGLVSEASAASRTRYRLKGQSAFAVAERHDDCIDASFSISASDETTKDGSDTTVTRSAFVGFGGRDLCNFLSFGNGVMVPLEVPLSTSSVTLPFDFMIDYANTETNERFQRRLVGSVTIVANGDFEKTRETIILENDNTRTVTRSKGNAREATATVTATLDGVPFAFEPGTGTLGTINVGTVEVVRY